MILNSDKKRASMTNNIGKKKVPEHLKHKPIYAINEYERVDGHYRGDTDVVGISLGAAQWSESETIPSVKVWRRKNGKYSRQSEETTLTRALDLATLIVNVLNKTYKGVPFVSVNSIFGNLQIEEVVTHADKQIELEEYLNQHKSDIEAHVNLLYDALKSYMGDK